MVAYARLLYLFVVPAGYVCLFMSDFGGRSHMLCHELLLISQATVYVTVSPSEEYREEAAGDIPFPVQFPTTLSADFYFIQATAGPVLLLGYV